MATQIHRAPGPRVRDRAHRRAEEKWRSRTVDATPDECYAVWRDVRNLPQFLSFVVSVEPEGETWSHWISKEGDEKVGGWTADLVEDVPGRSLEWRPLAHGAEPIAVQVRFDRAPGDRGTVVRLNLVRRTKSDPGRAIRELHRFKQLMETGEIATTQGQPEGRRGPIGRLLKKGESR